MFNKLKKETTITLGEKIGFYMSFALIWTEFAFQSLGWK